MRKKSRKSALTDPKIRKKNVPEKDCIFKRNPPFANHRSYARKHNTEVRQRKQNARARPLNVNKITPVGVH